MKTAIEELIEELNEYVRESHRDVVDIERLKNILTNQFIPKEKELMIEFAKMHVYLALKKYCDHLEAEDGSTFGIEKLYPLENIK